MKDGQLDITFARVARDQGMQQAKDHADAKKWGWSEEAYWILVKYIREHDTPFMIEEVRQYADKLGFDAPPSQRSWGSIVVRAVKAGLIERKGYGQVSNVKAHMANASIWQRK
jgi:hypothetical protein